VRSSLALLAALGAALVLAGPGGGAPGAQLADPSGDATERGLDPNVALEIRAARPVQTLPGALRTLAAETPSSAVARVIRAGLAAPLRAGLKLERLLARFSAVVLRVERSCPPPALLACRPGVRFMGRLQPGAPRPSSRKVEAVVIAELEGVGFEQLHAQRPPRGAGLAGRIGSRGETLARWRLQDRVLEVITGGLAPGAGAAELKPPAGTPPAVVINVNANVLSSLGGDRSR
jgi:hypothetical protein